MKLCADLSRACFGGFDAFWTMPLEQLGEFARILGEKS
jgi:hypothetical protein